MSLLRALLAHPLTRGLDIDDPRTTLIRRRIVQEKRGLRSIYEEWYDALVEHIPPGDGAVLELGSGGGFLAQRVPGVITSDVLVMPGQRLAADARALPLHDATLRSIAMVDVFHHIPDVGRFLSESERCLRSGGTLAMIEPWVTPFSTLIYRSLHHEPFETTAAEWPLPPGGPLSIANGALPWIVFKRDAATTRAKYASLHLRLIRPMTIITYLLSGGVSMRSLVPGFTWPAVRLFERLLSPLRAQLAMFALIVVERV